jgi:hypothetical protein
VGFRGLAGRRPQADLPFFDHASGSLKAIVGKPVGEIAKAELRSVFAAAAPVDTTPFASRHGRKCGHDERIEGEAVVIIQARACSCYVLSSSSAVPNASLPFQT